MVRNLPLFVIPAEAGIHLSDIVLDSRWSLPHTLMRGGNDNLSMVP
jgi:hypothetical protein